ncbi:MAG: peptidylprolyl isomerase [Sulfuricurvum sp.]
MITWMQKHKKYLVVTIWISTIAFVGAGFVGWGSYSYKSGSGVVAKVGDVDISVAEYQKSYAILYNQYSQMFNGEFDEEKASAFGLKQQALEFLTNQALVLNLANSYDIEVTHDEILADIVSKDYFFKDGVFSKEVYKDVLSRNNISVKEYEQSLKKELAVQKVLDLLGVKANEAEADVLNVALNIADRIEYKVLEPSSISVSVDEDALKSFWESMKSNFMSEVSYDVSFVTTPFVAKEYSDGEIEEFYEHQKDSFKDANGKILSLEDAREQVVFELNDKESKKEALREYIAFKKGEVDASRVQKTTISATSNPYGVDVLSLVEDGSKALEYIKPVLVDGSYYTFKVDATNSAKPLSFEEARAEVLPFYEQHKQDEALANIAKESLANFSGVSSGFITKKSDIVLEGLDQKGSKEFIKGLFASQKSEDFITLRDGNVVLYRIVEQKLLEDANENVIDQIAGIKSQMFNVALVKKLQMKYKTEILMQGI